MTSTPYSAKVVGSVVLAMFLIVGGDAAATVLTGAGFPQVFVAWTRFALAAVLLAPFCGLGRAELRHFLDWRLYLRACLIVGVCAIVSRTERVIQTKIAQNPVVHALILVF